MVSSTESSVGVTAYRWLVLARPMGAVLIATLPLVGLGYGLWELGSTVHPLVLLPRIAVLFVAWVFCHAGAMWLNAELDRDEGEVLFGRSVPVPRGTGALGYLSLALSVATSLLIGGVTTVCAALCALLCVLYSHPRTALKGRPLGGPLVNGLGYGLLSPIAGWAAAEGVITWRAIASLAFGVLSILGVYFAAQAFQEEEDRRRGYRTLVVTHGPRFTLRAARGCLVAAALGATVLAAIGAYPRVTLITIPFFLWMDRHIARWSQKADGGVQADATELVAIVTLAAVAMVGGTYAHQGWALYHDQPTGGCGTVIVPATLADVCGEAGLASEHREH